MTPVHDEVRLEVVGVFEQPHEPQDRRQRTPLLVLKDPSERQLHLSVGSCEGLAIHIAIEQHVVPRPLTHDLALRLLDRLSAAVQRVVILPSADHDPRAAIHLQTERGDLTVESGAGDAVALALRAEAPIYATEEVFSEASRSDDIF